MFLVFALVSACGAGTGALRTTEVEGCRLEVRVSPPPDSEVTYGTKLHLSLSSPNCELGQSTFLGPSDAPLSAGGPAAFDVPAEFGLWDAPDSGSFEGVVIARFVGRSTPAQVLLRWTVRDARRAGRLEVEPDRIALDVASRSVRIGVTAHYEDGSSAPVRNPTLRVADERVARPIGGSRIHGWSNGSSSLHVSFAGLEKEIPVRVSYPITVDSIEGVNPCEGTGVEVGEVLEGEIVSLYTGRDDGTMVGIEGCPLVTLDLGGRRLVGEVTADASGTATFCGPFDEAVQALVRDAGRTTCAVSRLRVPPPSGW